MELILLFLISETSYVVLRTIACCMKLFLPWLSLLFWALIRK